MEILDFLSGLIIGIFFMYVLGIKLLNNPKFQKIKNVLKKVKE